MIFVLWAIAILSLVALSFSKDTNMAISLKSINAERLRDSYAARGASLYALAKMSLVGSLSTTDAIGSTNTKGSLGFVTPGTPPIAGDAPDGTKTDNENSDLQESGKYNDNVKWNPSKSPYSVTIGNRDCDVYISSENGKINVNALNDTNREFLVNLLEKRDVDISDADTIADSILDWLDTDDLTHVNGAEDGYYGSLPDPYKAKDASFYSIEEMTLVKGVTPEIFERIRDFVTVYGNKDISVNVNIAPKEILSSIPGLSEDIADELSFYIEENGSISDQEELKQLFWGLGVIGDNFEDIKHYLTFKDSDYITISAFSSESTGMQKPSSESGVYHGYDYKLIVGKDDSGYKIYAAYPE